MTINNRTAGGPEPDAATQALLDDLDGWLTALAPALARDDEVRRKLGAAMAPVYLDLLAGKEIDHPAWPIVLLYALEHAME